VTREQIDRCAAALDRARASVVGRNIELTSVAVRHQLGVDQPERATEAVRAAIEMVDSRVADLRITLVDTIADDASSGAFVLGGTSCALDDVDVTAVDVVLERERRWCRDEGRSG
jgi:2-keto-4-pentenoate hydratase